MAEIKDQDCKYSIHIDSDCPTTSIDKNKTSGDYYCEECFCGFLELSDYERHIRDLHTADLPLNYNQGNRQFNRNEKSQRPIAMTNRKESNCKLTSEPLKRKSEIIVGNQRKSKEGNFKCTKCTKQFTSKNYLNRHYVTHSIEKKLFTCDLCNKKFTQKGDLKRHLLIHTGEKLFGCDHCNKKFTWKGVLKRHLLIHTGEKLFGCDQCNMKFTWKGDLKRHLLIHTGEKLFGCDHCNKEFSQKSNLKTHLH